MLLLMWGAVSQATDIEMAFALDAEDVESFMGSAEFSCVASGLIQVLLQSASYSASCCAACSTSSSADSSTSSSTGSSTSSSAVTASSDM